MSRHGEIVLAFGDQERAFRLGISQWAKIQEKCDVGPPELVARLSGGVVGLGAVDSGKITLAEVVAMGALGRWRLDDVREPIYQGLIGGGLPPAEAGRLVRDLVDERPLLESVPIAYRVALASLTGAADEPGEPRGVAAAPDASSHPSRAAS